uniref:Uncharacterized protein n=1 Tax=Avena sativa TaxID=4498 RepID=A0ACD5U9L5_AVESA
MARQRGRVLLRRVEDRRRRGICFRKRRAGLVKKAEELAVLCDADVALLVVSPFDGTFHRLAAPTTMENIIKRYQNSPAAQKRVHSRSLLKEVTKDSNIIKPLFSRVFLSFFFYWVSNIICNALVVIYFPKSRSNVVLLQ